MTRANRLKPIAGLAKDVESRAAAMLGHSRKALEDQQQRLSELLQFQREYQERFQALGQNGMDIQRVNEYRRFNERLNDAIRQQQSLLEEYRRNLEKENRNWSEASARRRSLDKTIDRFTDEEAVKAGRREQKEADEHARNIRSVMEESGFI